MVIVPLLKLPSLYFKGPCLGDGRNRPLCRVAENKPHPGDRKPSWTCCLGRGWGTGPVGGTERQACGWSLDMEHNGFWRFEIEVGWEERAKEMKWKQTFLPGDLAGCRGAGGGGSFVAITSSTDSRETCLGEGQGGRWWAV